MRARVAGDGSFPTITYGCKILASGFGALLRSIVSTIDKHGLTARHMGKHKDEVDRFFRSCKEHGLCSEAAEGLRNRLIRCQDKLFTFLDHDGIPWNNNNAENAVKAFATYREITDGQITEEGLNDYLVLLSVYQTCKYKGVGFLKFLLSQQTDIDLFRDRGGKKRLVSAVELLPEGCRRRSFSSESGCKRYPRLHPMARPE